MTDSNFKSNTSLLLWLNELVLEQWDDYYYELNYEINYCNHQRYQHRDKILVGTYWIIVEKDIDCQWNTNQYESNSKD